MSTKTISFQHSVSGVPTDVTSIVLSDPAASYGLRLASGGAAIIGAGTQLNKVSTGVYQITVADLTPGTAYRYWISWSYNGIPFAQNRTFVAGSYATPSCIYISYAEFIRRWGEKNVKVASNKENSSSETDFSAVQDCFDYAVEEIHTALRGGIYAVPLSFNDGVVPTNVKRWASTIAYADLYSVRGHEDKDRKGNKLTAALNEVASDLTLVRIGVKQLDAALAVDSKGHSSSPEIGHPKWRRRYWENSWSGYWGNAAYYMVP